MDAKPKSSTRGKLLYTQNSFLTCRSSTDSFLLCQTLQNIYKDTKQIRIQKCLLVSENDQNTHFKLDSEDTIDTTTILMQIKDLVHHTDKSISLKKEDIIETNERLKKVISPVKVRKRREATDSEAARMFLYSSMIFTWYDCFSYSYTKTTTDKKC